MRLGGTQLWDCVYIIIQYIIYYIYTYTALMVTCVGCQHGSADIAWSRVDVKQLIGCPTPNINFSDNPLPQTLNPAVWIIYIAALLPINAIAAIIISNSSRNFHLLTMYTCCINLVFSLIKIVFLSQLWQILYISQNKVEYSHGLDVWCM